MDNDIQKILDSLRGGDKETAKRPIDEIDESKLESLEEEYLRFKEQMKKAS